MKISRGSCKTSVLQEQPLKTACFIGIYAALTAAILFSMTACDIKDDDNNDDEVTNYGGSFKVANQQVWEGTDNNKISELYKKFEGEREISINVYWPDETKGFYPAKNLGAGKIENGLLDCEVPEPEAGELMEWNDFKSLFSAWNDLACGTEVKGTYLRFITSNDEWLNREKMSGSSDSLWLESIWFVYVDMDCTVTGTPSEGIRPGDAFYETPENLNLELKKGWNTVCRKQFLQGERGIETDSMKVKNPADFKWTIRPLHP